MAIKFVPTAGRRLFVTPPVLCAVFGLSVAAVCILPQAAYALDAKQVNDLVDQIGDRNFAPVEKFIHENEKGLAKDPDYYVVLLNYSLAKGDKSGLVIDQGTAKPGEFALSDPETHQPGGRIGFDQSFDDKVILDAIEKTQKALPSFRARLDVRFGLVEAESRIKRWELVGDQLVEILKVSREISNKWKWGPINSMDDEPEDFMLDNVQERVSDMFGLDDDKADQAVIRVSNALIKHYPSVIYGYANLGTIHLAKDEFKEAEKYFKQALEIDPDDEVVLENMKRLAEEREKLGIGA